MRVHVFSIALLLGFLAASPLCYAQEEPSTTAKPIIYEVEFDAEEPGSGDYVPLPECKLSYIKFERYYLRGVKEPNYISYNGSSFEDCEKKCCYETNLECKSFSYFSTLRVCFIMNVTKTYQKVSLIDAGPWTHVERVANREVTTYVPEWTTAPEDPEVGESTSDSHGYFDYATTVIAPESSGYESFSPLVPEEETTTTTTVFNSPAWREKTSTTPSSGSSKTPPRKIPTPKDPFVGSIDESAAPDRLVGVDKFCAKRCLNRGKCQMKPGEATDEVVEYCKCDKGYGGANCEKEVTEAGGFPAWLIVIIVLGSIILILFLTVFIMYQIYRRKTGEYKVVKQIQKWTRRGKKPKPTSNPEDYASPEGGHTSPTTSVQSIHGSVTSSTTHSTTTSV